MRPPNKELKGLGSRYETRANLEAALKEWFRNGGEPGQLHNFTINGIEYSAVKVTPLGNEFTYNFRYEDAQAIPVFVKTPRKKIKRDFGSPPEDVE